MTSDERQLIRQAQAGEPAAFAALYDRHRQAIFTYFYYRISDEVEAEELTAELFVRMVAKIARYRDEGRPLRAWLYTIAHNLLVDHYHHNGHMHHVPLGERLQSACPDPATLVDRELTAGRLRLALLGLTADQREVIVGKFIEDRSNAEVAALLEKTEGAVKSLQHRALAALRRALEKETVHER